MHKLLRMKCSLLFILLCISLTTYSQPGFYKEATILFRDIYVPDGKTVCYEDLRLNKVQIFTLYSSKQKIFARTDTLINNSFFIRLEGRSNNASTSLVIVTPTDTMFLFNFPDNNVNVDLRNLEIRTGIYDLRDYLDTITVDHGKCYGYRISNCAINRDSVVCEKGGNIKLIMLNRKSKSMADLRYQKPTDVQAINFLSTLYPYIFLQILNKQYSHNIPVYNWLKICADEGRVFDW